MTNTTWNPSDKTASVSLTGGNLTASVSATGNVGVRATDRQTTGKYYFEFTVTTTSSSCAVGIAKGDVTLPLNASGLVGESTLVMSNIGSATLYVEGITKVGALGSTPAGTVICVALDLDSRYVFFRIGAAGNWNGSAAVNPATNPSSGFAIPGVTAFYPYAGFSNNGQSVVANFGDSAFTGTVPSGFTSGFLTGTPTLIAATTQFAVEEWSDGGAAAQLSQLAVEQWASATADSSQAVVTQIAVEQWALNPSTVTAAQTAVSVIT